MNLIFILFHISFQIHSFNRWFFQTNGDFLNIKNVFSASEVFSDILYTIIFNNIANLKRKLFNHKDKKRTNIYHWIILRTIYLTYSLFPVALSLFFTTTHTTQTTKFPYLHPFQYKCVILLVLHHFCGFIINLNCANVHIHFRYNYSFDLTNLSNFAYQILRAYATCKPFTISISVKNAY